MTSTIKNTLISILKHFHKIIFGHEMSDVMKNFIKNLSWSFFGGFIAASIMFITNILAGRYLGARNYGYYNIIFSYASIVSLIITFGLDTSIVRYLPSTNNLQKKRQIIGTTFTTLLITSLLFFIYIAGAKWAGIQFLTLKNDQIIGLILAISISTKAIFNGYLRSIGEIKYQTLFKILDAVCVFIIVSYLFIIAKYFDTKYFILSLVAGSFIFSLGAFLKTHRLFGSFNLATLRKIFFEYNVFVLISYSSSIVLATNKLIIGNKIGITDLGIYSAYLFASTSVVFEITGIFHNVFWPIAIENKKNISSITVKIDQLLFLLAPLIYCSILILTAAIIHLFGNSFQLKLQYLVLFTTYSFLGFIYSSYQLLLGIDKIKRSTIVNVIYNCLPIAALYIYKNINTYLIVQILTLITLITYVRIQLRPVKNKHK